MNAQNHYPANLSSVYIQKRNYEMHKNNLVNIEVKQKINYHKSVSPSPIHLINKMNTKNFIQNENSQLEKNSQIRKENNRLLDKLIKISQRDPSFKRTQQNRTNTDIHSKAIQQRKQESQKIYQENQRIANRLLTSEAVTKKCDLERQYQNQKRIRQRISRQDWQLAIPQSNKHGVSRYQVNSSFERFHFPNVGSSQNRMSLQFPNNDRPFSVNDQRGHASFSFDKSQTLNQNFRMYTEPIQQNQSFSQNFCLKNPYLQQQSQQTQHNISQDYDGDIQINLNDSQINLKTQKNQQSQSSNIDYQSGEINKNNNFIQLQSTNQIQGSSNYSFYGQTSSTQIQNGNKENLNQFNNNNNKNNNNQIQNSNGFNSLPWSNTNQLQQNDTQMNMTNNSFSINSDQVQTYTKFNRNVQYNNMPNYNNMMVQYKANVDAYKQDYSMQQERQQTQ